MTPAFIDKLRSEGEGLQIEFKESFHDLNKNTFDSICAFLNRKGGQLVLGLSNSGNVEGVLDATKLQMAIINDANNPQKLQPVFPLSPEIIDYEGKQLIYVYIPESSMVHQTAGKTFDRSGDADLDISKQQAAIAELHLRKQQKFTENKIYPYLKLEDLRPDLIDRARRLARGQKRDHPWLALSDEDLLRSAGLYQRDFATGQEGYTLAAALLFGTDEVILNIVPYYKTDAIYRVQNLDRYDDRDIVSTNLIEAYDRLMAFIAKHLPDPFYQEPDTQRVSIRDIIFREVVANMLVHREYANPYIARLVIERDRVVAENWNKPHVHGHLYPDSFSPFTKNPVLAKFFREIGRMDELGSGMRRLFHYGPNYASGRKPEVIEEDVFKIIVPVEPSGLSYNLLFTLKEPGSNSQIEGTIEGTIEGMIEGTIEGTIPGLSDHIRQRLVRILFILYKEQGLRANDISRISDFGIKNTERYIKLLREAGLIEFIGPKSTGGYYLTEKVVGVNK